MRTITVSLLLCPLLLMIACTFDGAGDMAEVVCDGPLACGPGFVCWESRCYAGCRRDADCASERKCNSLGLCVAADHACSSGATRKCYSGPTATQGQGMCRAGLQRCRAGQWAPTCAGEVLPGPEICNNLDDDCDGDVDEGLDGSGCYDGPAATAGVGICRGGKRACVSGRWGACRGQVLPRTETCDGKDDDCDGTIDEGCQCKAGASRVCYPGPSGTEGVGSCREGRQRCSDEGQWGFCQGHVVPAKERCNGLDDDCDGETDEEAPCPDGTTCSEGRCRGAEESTDEEPTADGGSG